MSFVCNSDSTARAVFCLLGLAILPRASGEQKPHHSPGARVMEGGGGGENGPHFRELSTGLPGAPALPVHQTVSTPGNRSGAKPGERD